MPAPDEAVSNLGADIRCAVSEALRRIRSGGFEVPVIFLTARDEVTDRVRGFDVGGDDYVTKPFSLDELLGRIRAVLKRTRPGSPGSQLRVAMSGGTTTRTVTVTWSSRASATCGARSTRASRG